MCKLKCTGHVCCFLGAGAVLSGLRVEGSAKTTMQTAVGGCSLLPVQCTLGSIKCTDNYPKQNNTPYNS